MLMDGISNLLVSIHNKAHHRPNTQIVDRLNDRWRVYLQLFIIRACFIALSLIRKFPYLFFEASMFADTLLA